MYECGQDKKSPRMVMLWAKVGVIESDCKGKLRRQEKKRRVNLS